MNNREKIISAIEKAKKQSEEYAQDRIIVPFKKADMILDLLKEPEARWISAPHKKARICSRCYADEPYKFADEDADAYDYCPHCGARMINRR